MNNQKLTLEGKRIGFLNFAGRADAFTAAGNRNFCVFLSFEEADELAANGWAVKYPKENPNIPAEEDKREPYMKVRLKVEGGRPPKIVMVCNGQQTLIEGDAVGQLDNLEIVSTDLVVRPYHWTNLRGESGITAWLEVLYVTINADPFQAKYGM